MDPERFRKSQAGRVVKAPGGYWAFVPAPLPPQLAYGGELVAKISRADRLLGELSGIGSLIPNPHLLVAPYLRREAVLSSRIEGTVSSLSDLLLLEATDRATGTPQDLLEVRNYVRALSYGLERVKTLPLSLRLIRETHRELLTGVRGEHKTPGEFRKAQNWIGGLGPDDAVFVPPPPLEMGDAMGEFEAFLWCQADMPPLVQCALLHYQFEAIHPFLDGNGRIGRLLITLFLCTRGCLSQPLLYLSVFFEKHRDEYYRRLLGVSQGGDWTGWLLFFLEGVASQAADAIERSQRILGLLEAYRHELQKRRAPASAFRLLDEVFLNPYVTVPGAARTLGVGYTGAKYAVTWLRKAGILNELPLRLRPKAFWSEELLRAIGGPETA